MMLGQHGIFLSALLLAGSLVTVHADIPVHCLYNTTVGRWKVSMGRQELASGDSCADWQPVEVLNATLSFPDKVETDNGLNGTWTLIYDEGVEVRIGGNRYFGYFDYTEDGEKVVSHCGTIAVNYFHETPEVGKKPQYWGCWTAERMDDGDVTLTYSKRGAVDESRVARDDPEFANAINSRGLGWEAVPTPAFAGRTIAEVARQTGVRRTKPRMSLPRQLQKTLPNADFPKEFDWGDKDGDNYLGPVRSQGNCGSCYTFATTNMLNARLRIDTRNKNQALYSPQNIVSCSNYSQGCDGGFAFLASKFGMDYGMVSEECFPYAQETSSKDAPCSKRCDDPAQEMLVDEYGYVGGYYGASSEDVMKQELMDHGPMAVGMEVYNDFLHYSGGIYRHSGLVGYNPFVETNHAVLLVGWGEEGGVPYWRVMNSWGLDWGEDGFFRILRGVDEVGIESMPEWAAPHV